MKTEEELIWESYITEKKGGKGGIEEKLARHMAVKLSEIKKFIKDKPHLTLTPTKSGYLFSNSKTNGKTAFHLHNEGVPLDRGSVKNIFQVITGQSITR